mgnify:FL=1
MASDGSDHVRLSRVAPFKGNSLVKIETWTATGGSGSPPPPHVVGFSRSGGRVFLTVERDPKSGDPLLQARPAKEHSCPVTSPAGTVSSQTCAQTQSLFVFPRRLGEGIDELVMAFLCPSEFEADPLQSNKSLCINLVELQGKVMGLMELSLNVHQLGASSVQDSCTPDCVKSVVEESQFCSNELLSEHVLPARRFVCLCNNGIYYVEKQRPVDEFLQWLSNWHASGVSDGINPRSTPRSALRRSGVSFSAAASSSSSSSPSYSLSSDGDSGVPPSWIHAFCNQYEPSEVCIMCFCLLSGMISLPEGASRGARKEELLQKVRSVLHTYRSLPQWNEVSHGGDVEDVIVIEKSPSQLMEGILRLLGRILRPVFVDPCFQEDPITGRIEVSFSEALIARTQQLLQQVESYDCEGFFLQSRAQSKTLSQRTRKTLLWEHDLYVNAMQTSRSCRELLQLLMVISRFQSLPRLQEAMRQWSEIPSFSDLLRFRPARMVLRALLASTAEEDPDVNDELHRKCPHLYRAEGVDKGFWLLQRLKHVTDPVLRQEMEVEAKECYHADLEHLDLSQVAEDFLTCDCDIHAVELLLAANKELYPLSEEIRGAVLNEERLRDGRRMSGSALTTLEKSRFNASLILDIVEKLRSDCVDERFLATLSVCLKTRDIVLHFEFLLPWLLRSFPEEVILNVGELGALYPAVEQEIVLEESFLLERFLRKLAERASTPRHVKDLLWKLYEFHGRFREAALVLEYNAFSREENLSFDERVEYLRRSITTLQKDIAEVDGGNVARLIDLHSLALLQKTAMQRLCVTDSAEFLLEADELFKWTESQKQYDLVLVVMYLCHLDNHRDRILSVWKRFLVEEFKTWRDLEARLVTIFSLSFAVPGSTMTHEEDLRPLSPQDTQRAITAFSSQVDTLELLCYRKSVGSSEEGGSEEVWPAQGLVCLLLDFGLPEKELYQMYRSFEERKFPSREERARLRIFFAIERIWSKWSSKKLFPRDQLAQDMEHFAVELDAFAHPAAREVKNRLDELLRFRGR